MAEGGGDVCSLHLGRVWGLCQSQSSRLIKGASCRGSAGLEKHFPVSWDPHYTIHGVTENAVIIMLMSSETCQLTPLPCKGSPPLCSALPPGLTMAGLLLQLPVSPQLHPFILTQRSSPAGSRENSSRTLQQSPEQVMRPFQTYHFNWKR